MRLLMLVVLVGCLAIAPQTARAFVFTPGDADLQDLPHEKYFKWGINFTLPEDHVVTYAAVVFHDIYNWTNEDNDRLWLHLLDNTSRGVSWGTDNEASGTWFAAPRYTQNQILLNEFANLPEGSGQAQDITYEFDAFERATIEGYAADGRIGLGLDPDCHFYNTGVQLQIETGVAPPVPEPTTIALFGFGLVGLAGLMRNRFRRGDPEGRGSKIGA